MEDKITRYINKLNNSNESFASKYNEILLTTIPEYRINFSGQVDNFGDQSVQMNNLRKLLTEIENDKIKIAKVNSKYIYANKLLYFTYFVIIILLLCIILFSYYSTTNANKRTIFIVLSVISSLSFIGSIYLLNKYKPEYDIIKNNKKNTKSTIYTNNNYDAYDSIMSQ